MRTWSQPWLALVVTVVCCASPLRGPVVSSADAALADDNTTRADAGVGSAAGGNVGSLGPARSNHDTGTGDFASGGGGTTAAGSYTTDFNLRESPISEGGVWHHTGLDWTLVVTGGGLAYGTQAGNGGYDDSYAYLSGFPPDQSASGVVHIDSAINGSTTHEVEILLRWADSAHNARGYECSFAFNGQYADIVRWNGAKGDFTFVVPTLTASIPGGLHEGDTVSAKIVGNRITTYVNGKQLLTAMDSTFTDGNPGMGYWRGAPSTPINDFAFTHYTAAPATQ
jgi:hypothetical protein